MKDKRPKKLRVTIEELELLNKLKESASWDVVKRVSFRYIRNLKDVSFKLPEANPNYLAVRHAELIGQALGIRMLLRFIENSGKRLEEMEKNE